MVQSTNVFEEGFDRFQSAVKDIDREVQKVRKQLTRRRRSFERELRSRRLELEKRAEKRVRRLRSELRRLPVLKRAEELQAGTVKRFEKQVDNLLAVFPASRTEMKRLDRRVAQLQKKVRALEKSNGAATSV